MKFRGIFFIKNDLTKSKTTEISNDQSKPTEFSSKVTEVSVKWLEFNKILQQLFQTTTFQQYCKLFDRTPNFFTGRIVQQCIFR
jgi:hypothetical protein